MPRLDEKALLVKLSITGWTAKKEDKKVTKEVETNHGAHDAGRYNKHLLAKTALEKINKNTNEARTFHYAHTLPWSIDGQDILPTKIYFEYTQAMGEFKATQEANVKEFLDNYPQYIEEAKARLNGLFRPEDYPPVDKVKKKFSFTLQFFPIPAQEDFRVDLQTDEIRKIQTELENQLKATEQEAIKDLWERLYKTVSHAAERLGDPEAVFRNSLVENIQELVNLLPKLNFTEDPELEKMRREVEKKLLKFNPDTLREDKEARRQTAQEAQDLLKNIKSHVTEANGNGNQPLEASTPATAPRDHPAAPEEAKAKLQAMATLF